VLALLCEAEAATVVNNCAAALVLIVRHFTRTKTDVVISRGELVQIGGGFRIAEIIEATGAKLREVGATNKTTMEDYANASVKHGNVLRVHRVIFHERFCRITVIGEDQRSGTQEARSVCRGFGKRGRCCNGTIWNWRS
jgi:L-seryl-tRNA(Ser) seleniumtransferase